MSERTTNFLAALALVYLAGAMIAAAAGVTGLTVLLWPWLLVKASL